MADVGYWELIIKGEPIKTREAFVRGMIAAIRGFGIMKEGQLLIGCQEESVSMVQEKWLGILVRSQHGE